RVRWKRKEGDGLAVQWVCASYRNHRMQPGKVPFHPLEVDNQNDENQVGDDGDPRGFAAARARQVVLQLDEQVRHAGSIVIEIAVSRFPSLGIVQAELFRLWLLGGSHRILEWNLRDGHELG